MKDSRRLGTYERDDNFINQKISCLIIFLLISVCHWKNGWRWRNKTRFGFSWNGKSKWIFTKTVNWMKLNESIKNFQKTDVTVELIEDIQTKTKEYLQPNPTARAKMIAVKGISKLSGQAKSNTYPQAEGVLADCMLIYGKRLGEESSVFGK